MARNLSHDGWVKQQFKEKYLKSEYRNVLIHASIIEGTLRNESGRKTFDSANKRLSSSGRITPSEFSIFDEIRRIRNSLVHDSFRNGLLQNQIDGLRDELMRKILAAYRSSSFLEDTLFRKYAIVPVPIIG
jgi:hypothetical protein